jgi:hypothetical protein
LSHPDTPTAAQLLAYLAATLNGGRLSFDRQAVAAFLARHHRSRLSVRLHDKDIVVKMKSL